MPTRDEKLCPADVLASAIALAENQSAAGLVRFDDLANAYPDDPQVGYIRGALLAAERRYDEAMSAMRDALRLAPDLAPARFQLGLLELTSGDRDAACAVWRPLRQLPTDDPLHIFAEGLEHLAFDRLEEALASLQQGISLNTQNAPLNADMQLVIGQILALQAEAPSDETVSSAQLLLSQAMTSKRTMH